MIDIFYKSYRKDFKFLYYSLMSIQKHVTGYNKIHIVIPSQDWELLDHRKMPANTVVHKIDESGNGYLFQQYVKMSAHKYCDADKILYADSDCLFDKPIDLSKLSENPEILYTDYSKVGDAICWKAPTDKFMNESQDFEFMRRLPLIYRRSTIETIYNLVPNLKDIIMNSGGFSEFNALGAWAFKHEKDKYSFVNTDNWEYVEPMTKQLWSHAKKSGSQLEMSEYNKAVYEISRVLELNIVDL